MATAVTKPVCEQKLILARDYSLYAAQHARAVRTLRQRMGIVSRLDYEDLVRATEDARALSEKARLAFEQHPKEHGC